MSGFEQLLAILAKNKRHKCTAILLVYAYSELAGPATANSTSVEPSDEQGDAKAQESPEPKKRGRSRPLKSSKLDSDSSNYGFLESDEDTPPEKKKKAMDERTESEAAHSTDAGSSKPEFNYGKAIFTSGKGNLFLIKYEHRFHARFGRDVSCGPIVPAFFKLKYRTKMLFQIPLAILAISGSLPVV